MLTILLGDITEIRDVDYICNPANGWGYMAKECSRVIGRAAGTKVRAEAIWTCLPFFFRAGSLFMTSAGKIPVRGILHLVTSNRPGIAPTVKTVKKCLVRLVTYCKTNDVKKVALPALGIEDIEHKQIAAEYARILSAEDGIEFVVVDTNEQFISELRQYVR